MACFILPRTAKETQTLINAASRPNIKPIVKGNTKASLAMIKRCAAQMRADGRLPPLDAVDALRGQK